MFLKETLRKGEALDGAVAALPAAGTAVAVRRLNALHVHQHRLVYLRVEVEAADGERAYRLAMVAVREADEFRLLGMSRLVLVLEGHLERTFDGGGAVVGEVEFRQAARHDFGKFLTEPYRRFVREVREYHVLEAVELRLYRIVYRGVAVAEQVAPP